MDSFYKVGDLVKLNPGYWVDLPAIPLARGVGIVVKIYFREVKVHWFNNSTHAQAYETAALEKIS